MTIVPRASFQVGDNGTGREIRLDPKAFRRIAGLIREVAGINLPETKMTLVQARLAKRLRALGLRSYRDYCDVIERTDEEALAERQELVTAITTNVTRFFREPHHFEMLRTRVLPPLIARAVHGGRVRIWSAGCSTGEEPYSIALTLLQALPDAGRYDIKILATDLDRAVLATATRAVYPERALEAVPPALRWRYFEAVRPEEPEGYSVATPVRSLVIFKQLGLTAPWPMKRSFDIIFCRNVAIYFDSSTEMQVWKGFSELLPVGGWLFVGHSERVNTLALPMFRSDGVTSYRRV